jgi:hypothetical protein
MSIETTIELRLGFYPFLSVHLVWTIKSSLSFVDKSPRLRSSNELLIQLPNRAGLCSQHRKFSCRLNSIDPSERVLEAFSVTRATQFDVINSLGIVYAN